ncbi:MAG: LamG-like jellyroll fold domain-containing protein [Patescibacteria group bacterium]
MPSKKSLSFRPIIGLMLASLFLSNFSLILAKKAQAQESEPEISNQITPVDPIIQPVDNSNGEIMGLPIKEIAKPIPSPIFLDPVVEDPVLDPIIEEPSLDPIIEPGDQAPISDDGAISNDTAEEMDMMSGEDGVVDMYGNRDNVGKQPKDKVGSYNIDELTGLFSYSYSLSIPKGRTNLQPDIALQYNHRQVNIGSMAGFGWSLYMPSIERDNRTGIDNIYNEKYFILNLGGSSQLQPISVDSSGYGTYGKLVDSNFAKVEFSSENKWIVTDRLGTAYTFGADINARQDNPNNSTQIYKWMLQEIRDTNDNFVRYEYYKDSGQIYPKKIFYTGSGVTDGIYEVDFQPFASGSLTQNNIANSSYQTGFEVKTQYLLDRIEIKVEGQIKTVYDLVQHLNETSSKYLLQSIVPQFYNGGAGFTKDQVDFQYSYQATTYSATSQYDLPNNMILGAESQQGYGKQDYFLDLNSDSYTDFIRVSCSSGQVDVDAWLNNGQGAWATSTAFDLSTSFSGNCGGVFGGTYYSLPLTFANLNGDHFMDMAMDDRFYINSGSGWQQSSSTLPVSLTQVSHAGLPPMNLVIFQDMNADGYDDIIYNNHTDLTANIDVYLRNIGTGGWILDNDYHNSVTMESSDCLAYGGDPYGFADLNNDGLGDVFYKYSCQYGEHHEQGEGILFNTGSSFISGTVSMDLPIMSYFLDIATPEQTVNYFSDLDGDGLSDRGYYHKVEENSTWSQGNLSLMGQTVFDTGDIEDYGDYYKLSLPVAIADFNGDQVQDIIHSGGSFADTYFGKGEKLDIMREIDNQSGSKIYISYGFSAQEKNTDGSLANPDLPFNMYVAREVVIDDGVNNWSGYQYQYAAGKTMEIASEKLRDVYGFAKVTNRQGQALPIDLGDGSDGVYVSTGNDIWETDKNFTSILINEGHTVVVKNGIKIKNQGVAVINGILSALGQGYQYDESGPGQGGSGLLCGIYNAAGGGGGSYGGLGTAGQEPSGCSNKAGQPGPTYGYEDLNIMFLGSSGGNGGDVGRGGGYGDAGAGGNGGGIIILNSLSLELGINGQINANGQDGGSATLDSGLWSGAGGGGGSGGSIYIQTIETTSIGSGQVKALGGQGGNEYHSVGMEPSGNGGVGGDGRIRIESYNGQINGSSQPNYFSNTEFIPSVSNIYNDINLQKIVNDYNIASDAGLYLHGKVKYSSRYDWQDNMLGKKIVQWQTEDLGQNRRFVYSDQDTDTQIHLLEGGPLREYDVDANTVALYHMNGIVGTQDKKDNAQGNGTYDLVEEGFGSANVDTGFNGQANGAYKGVSTNTRAYAPVYGIGDDAFTLEMWIKYNGSVLTMRPFGKINNSNLGFVAEYDNNQNYIWFYSQSDKYTWTVHSAQNSIHLGQWQHYAFVVDTQNAYIYIDGDLSGQGPVTYNGGDAVNEKLYLFCHKANCNDAGPFSIDELRISNIARNSQEIFDYYHNTQEPYYETSVASQYEYNTDNGNLLTKHDLGKVTVNLNTGQITDQLTGDEKDTNYEYAQNTTKHILAAPKNKEISSIAESKDQDLYYDNLPLGQVEKVNLTKEDYKTDAVEVKRVFNSYGLVSAEIDPKNATTTIVYDSPNLYPASATNALNQVTLTDYNLFNGQVASSTDPNGSRTVNTFDAFGRLVLTQISDPGNPTTLLTKQEISYQDTILPRYKEVKDYYTASQYQTSREYYDGLNRVVQKKSQTGNSGEYATVDISYDAQGRVERQSLPYMTSSLAYSSADLSKPAKTYTYDAQDRILTETTPVGTSSYEYDGFITVITDANGHVKELTKDAYGNLVQVKEHNGASVYTTNYEYTLTNKLKKITDSAGNIRNFSYDALDNLTWQDMVHKPSVANPAKIQYTYDKNGNVLTETSFKNDAISYTYDNLNRVLNEKLSGATKINYTYDNGQYNKGKLIFADYGLGNSKRYNYDILGRLTTATTTIANEPFVLKYEYNLAGALSKVTYPNNWQVAYSFNDIGQVSSISLDKGQGPINIATNIIYNQNGQMTHLERDNDAITDYTYDPNQAFRLTRILTTSGQDTLQDLNYTYDDVGNILNIVDNANTDLKKSATYTYDDLNRLLSATVSYTNHPDKNYTQTFTYDSIGNMTANSDLGTMNYLNNNPHQLTSVGSRNFVYDNAGNLNREIGLRKYYWDHRNRLKNTFDIASEDNTYYLYDHNNQRFIKWTEDYLYYPPDPEIPTESLSIPDRGLDNLDSTEELTLDGGTGYWAWTVVSQDKYVDKYFEKNLNNQTKTHLYLDNIKLATINNNGNPNYILSDHLSSSDIIIDSSGSIMESTDYKPFGSIQAEYTVTDPISDYKFSGKEVDEESALQYFGARYNDNQLGRFITIDPLLLDLEDSENYNKQILELFIDPQQLNSYSYARNNPIIYTDPSGQYVETALDLISLALSYYDYQHKKSTWNMVFLGLDIVGVAAPLPSLGLAKNGYRTYKIADYFHGIAKNVDDVINLGELFVKNANFKFTQRAWSAGEAGNDVASLVGHYYKHGAEVGAKNVDEYYSMANSLINSADNTTVFKLDGVYGKGYVDYFNPTTRELVGLNKSGQISSYQMVYDQVKFDKLSDAVNNLR